jgi:hypothetical protein
MSTGKIISPIVSAGTDQATATPITRDTNWTVVQVNVGNTDATGGVSLPDNPHLGDIVEIHNQGIAAIIYPNVGALMDISTTQYTAMNATFRYIATNLWANIAAPQSPP